MAVVSGSWVHLPGKLSAYLEFKLPQLDIFSRGLLLARYLRSGWLDDNLVDAHQEP